MPPKKAPAKETPAVKKTATATKKASTTKKVTPKKPTGIIKKAPSSANKTPSKPAGVAKKKKTPSKSASAAKKPTGGRALRSADPNAKPPVYATAEEAKKNIEADLSTYMGAGSTPNNAIWGKRAAELYRRYGTIATEKHGFDHHQLMNACLALAWHEADWAILPSGDGHYVEDAEYRTCRVDEGHDWREWMGLSSNLQKVIRPLMQEIQTAKQKANMQIPHHPIRSPAIPKAATKAKAGVEKTPAETGSTVTKKAASVSKKASVRKTPSKSTGIIKKTPSKSVTSAKKAALSRP